MALDTAGSAWAAAVAALPIVPIAAALVVIHLDSGLISPSL
jgi:hypothetical protein